MRAIKRALVTTVTSVTMAVSCTPAPAGQEEHQGQGQTTVNTSTYAPVQNGDVTTSSSMGNSSYVGNTSSSSGAQSQAQSQSQSNSTATTTGGTTNATSGSTSGDAATTSGAATSTTNAGAVNSNNVNRSRAYALALSRPVTSTTPMNCIVSESKSFDVTIFGASSSVSRMDDHCMRRVAVANACSAAVALDAVDALRAEHARETAAALECADERISKAFASPSACAAAMKVSTCPIRVPDVVIPTAPAPVAIVPTPAPQVIERIEVRYLPAPVPVVTAAVAQPTKRAPKRAPRTTCVVRPVCSK
jgi:hypothetical protein